MVVKRETKFGFHSYLYFTCTKCLYVDVIKTEERGNDLPKKPDINYSAVLGIMSIGSAFHHLEEISSK